MHLKKLLKGILVLSVIGLSWILVVSRKSVFKTSVVDNNSIKVVQSSNTPNGEVFHIFSSNNWHGNGTRQAACSAAVNRYAVFGVAMPNLYSNFGKDVAWQYVFYIPIVVHAWWLQNVSSVVIIAGENVTEDIWKGHPVFRTIYRIINSVPCVRFVYMESSESHKVVISQTARIFASSLASGIAEEDVLITSDSDLIPLSPKPYEDIEKDTVLMLNAFCCGDFSHRGKSYRMTPMSNIATSVKMWKKIIENNTVQNSADLIGTISKYYPIPEQIVKGVNDGWFMDQHLVSILLTNSTVKQKPVERSMATRIDRSHGGQTWVFDKIGSDMMDAHMPLPGWEGPNKVKNLTHALFKDKSLVRELDTYIDNFETAIA